MIELNSEPLGSEVLERGRAEADVIDQGELWRIFFEQNRDGIVVLRTDGSVYRANNRFAEEIDRATRYARPMALIMYDIDHFKCVNDTFGHGAGDEVLTTVVELVNEHIRSVDTHGRWGGEEFMVLLPETGLAAAVASAERLREAIAGHGFAHVESVTASFGVTALGPGDGFDALVKRADEALYLAKSRGRNRVESAWERTS